MILRENRRFFVPKPSDNKLIFIIHYRTKCACSEGACIAGCPLGYTYSHEVRPLIFV